VEGDILIMDNAAVHGSSDTLELLLDLLKLFGIRLVYIPVYSPEFNPCELIFAQVKCYLRTHRDFDLPLHYEVAFGFAFTGKCSSVMLPLENCTNHSHNHKIKTHLQKTQCKISNIGQKEDRLVTITQKKYILEMLKCFQHGKLS
jgi:hypothetical protein